MQRLKQSDIKSLVLAGNATITLESGATGKHFTYKIKRCENDDNLYFVRLLTGEDNEKSYTYIGCYYADSGYFHPVKKYASIDRTGWPKSMRAIHYLFVKIDDVPDNLHVYHAGKCCRCGRKLTTPESIEKGIGPECEKYL